MNSGKDQVSKNRAEYLSQITKKHPDNTLTLDKPRCYDLSRGGSRWWELLIAVLENNYCSEKEGVQIACKKLVSQKKFIKLLLPKSLRLFLIVQQCIFMDHGEDSPRVLTQKNRF